MKVTVEHEEGKTLDVLGPITRLREEQETVEKGLEVLQDTYDL